MELKQLWAVVVRRWWLILLPALVAMALTLPGLRDMISPPHMYLVAVRFTAGQVPTADSARTFEEQSYITWLGSEYAVNNLASWMKTDSFAREVAKALEAQGKKLDSEAIRAALASDSARSIMTLYVTWPDPEEIKVIAQAGIDVLRGQSQVYFPQLGAGKASIIPLDGIIVAPVAPPIATRLAPLFRALIGLIAGLALAFLAEYLDPTLRSRAEVEALGLPVIAEIPRH